jgi:hypothetical protein
LLGFLLSVVCVNFFAIWFLGGLQDYWEWVGRKTDYIIDAERHTPFQRDTDGIQLEGLNSAAKAEAKNK